MKQINRTLFDRGSFIWSVLNALFKICVLMRPVSNLRLHKFWYDLTISILRDHFKSPYSWDQVERVINMVKF